MGATVSTVNVKTNTSAAALAAALGGGATYNSTTGQVTNPKYVLGYVTYNNVGSALTSLNQAIEQVEDGLQYTMNGMANSLHKDIVKEEQARHEEDKLLERKIGETNDKMSYIDNIVIGGTNRVSGDTGSRFKINKEVGSSDSVVGALYLVGSELEEHENRLDYIESKTGLIQQGSAKTAIGARAAPDPTIYIGETAGGKLVNITGTEGERVLTGVENGRIADDSTDAVVILPFLMDRISRIKCSSMAAYHRWLDEAFHDYRTTTNGWHNPEYHLSC